MARFYVTTAIDYTNDVIHIGHAYQKIVADCIARYYRLKLGSKNTFFLTGTDEHGIATEKKAKKLGVSPQRYVDEISRKDKEQLDALNISYDRFIRTSDEDHKKAVGDFWLRVKKNNPDDIYLGNYEGLYCERCEAFITRKELVDSRCPYHPTIPIKQLVEENYFFRWSRYQQFLIDHITDNPLFIQPTSRRHEMLSFAKSGIWDIPVSRPGIEWGVSVPDDPKHTIYVWFDALINYISGAPKLWPADLHILGKDNIRWHALLWPAMLKSAGYQLPKVVYGHDFLTLNGQKISKSLGNIIRPTDLVSQFGVDSVRYFFLRYGPLSNDVDISSEKIAGVHNADLANGLGNLVQRTAKLCQGLDLGKIKYRKSHSLFDEIGPLIENFRFNDALSVVWKTISGLDRYLNQKRPWKKTSSEKIKILNNVVLGGESITSILEIAEALQPFIPETTDKIEAIFKGQKIKAPKPLFPRINRKQ